ncbi:hypothetical protein [Stenotrophomonas oahuensis]|uniref:Uncharacterized protein n=1 Tax=Stenotrophomonas oahuensis TaxID=3003271 RepID=A0ABY9YQY1_9GAMM|nr:hypothetical protein [Stenotrophomonas sp. A5586]WNH53320.1 hypothetical protein PDM29_03320 [Stenotrophomonas sp. A5586]
MIPNGLPPASSISTTFKAPSTTPASNENRGPDGVTNAYISFGLQEYHAPACARLAGIDHEAEQTRQKQEVSAQAHDQLVNFATNFFTIKNTLAQKAVDADKPFITGL